MADLQDDELYLPRTVVNKLIKEMVPNIRVSTDARDLLLNCCSEFIHLLASEASEASERQQKKVISPGHHPSLTSSPLTLYIITSHPHHSPLLTEVCSLQTTCWRLSQLWGFLSTLRM
jgi:histone H3/H4